MVATINEKYMVSDEQPGKQPKLKGFEKKKDANEYYLDLLDDGKNKTGDIFVWIRKGKEYRWIMQSSPTSRSGRKNK
jgi:hypothetical protein